MRYKVNGGIKAARRDVPDVDDYLQILEYLKVLERVGHNAPDDQIGMKLTSIAFYVARSVPEVDYAILYYVLEPLENTDEPALICIHRFEPFDSRWT